MMVPDWVLRIPLCLSCVGVAVHGANGWVGEPRQDRHLVAQRREHLHAPGELEVLAAAVRKPGPFLVCRVLG